MNAFASPGLENCMAAFQKDLVFLCIQNLQRTSTTRPEGVSEFKADAKYGIATEIVMLDQAILGSVFPGDLRSIRKPALL